MLLSAYRWLAKGLGRAREGGAGIATATGRGIWRWSGGIEAGEEKGSETWQQVLSLIHTDPDPAHMSVLRSTGLDGE